MEDILDVYRLPYDPDCPVICMDEKPYQLLRHVRKPMAMTANHPQREDSEYIRNGTCSIFVFTEPLTGWTHADAKERRTRIDWAEEIRILLREYYPQAPKIRLVMDNLNTHTIRSLYEAFKPEVAHKLAKRLEIHYTPKHGSWLNIAEIQISALSRQCLARRIESLEKVNSELIAWEKERDSHPRKINWQFTVDDARIKLHYLYPDV